MSMSHEFSAIDTLSQKLADLLKNSPAKDFESNVKASLNGFLSKLDLVTREEFDVQSEVLARTREKLTQLEARLRDLESRNQASQD